MAIKQCNHCQVDDGVGIELVVEQSITCPECGCIWDTTGYHMIEGSQDGKKCDYPQPQPWGDSPAVQIQRDFK